MASMLSQIRKDKDEIQGIDDLIRNQRWEEARKLIESPEEKDKKSGQFEVIHENECEEEISKEFQVHKRDNNADNWEK